MRVVIAVGSNLGDRPAAVAFAVRRLAGFVSDLVLSEVIETEPEGESLRGQPPYLNAVVVGETALEARQVLESLLQIECDFGRTRPVPNAARTLDLDLILLGDQIIDEPGLRVPHPRFRDRFFVLGPLTGIAPNIRDPETGLQIWELLQALLRDESR